MKFKDILAIAIRSILAGMAISLGCIASLLAANKVVGAVFFTVGLFLVLTRQYDLYTGKIGYVFCGQKYYAASLPLVLIGNLAGTAVMFCISLSSKLSSLRDVAALSVHAKLNAGYLSAFFMAFLCGVIIYLAVDNFKNNASDVGKYLGLLFLIPLFVFCGYEHCVADMYYILLSNVVTAESLLFLVIVVLGNSAGSICAKYLETIARKA